MAAFLYEFDWDPVKAQTNFVKHGWILNEPQPFSWTLLP